MDTDSIRRRSLLGSSAAMLTLISGCSELASSTGSSNDTNSDKNPTSDVKVENQRDAEAEIAVRIWDIDGNEIFNRIYSLEPGHRDETGEISRSPSTVHVFTQSGLSREFEYEPEVNVPCDPKGIEIRVVDSSIVYFGTCE